MALGLSFGSNKSKTNQTTTLNKTTTQDQQGLTSQAQVEQQSSLTQGASQTATQGATAQQSTGATSSQTTGRESQTGTTSLFSQAVLGALEAAGLSSLATVGGQPQVDVSRLAFDSDQFIADAVTRASAAAGVNRELGTNALYDQIGGTASGNTMAALLDQQLAIQQQGAVAGARNDASRTAAEISRSNIGSELAVQGQQQGLMGTLLQLLRGGQATQSTVGEQSQQQQTASAESQTAQSQQLQEQSTQQATQAINSLVSLISQLVSGTSVESGTETVVGKTKKSGGGFSLSL